MRIRLIPLLVSILLSTCVHSRSLLAQPGQVNASGVTIAYESFGAKSDEVILLIAGTNEQLTMWPVEFCVKLAKHKYRVIRFDNRDIGLSTKFAQAGMPDWAGITKALQEKATPPLPYSLDDMAIDAVNLLDALGLKKAHIVGASMGGMIAQRVAYNHPEHTLTLTSIMAGGGNATFPLVAKPELVSKIPAPGPTADTAAYIRREIQSVTILSGPVYPPDPKALLVRITADVNRSYYPDGLVRQGAASLAAFYAGRQEKLKTIRVPALVIHGDQDPLVAIEAGKDVADLIPGAEFEVVKGMGHAISTHFFTTLVDLIAKNAKKK